MKKIFAACVLLSLIVLSFHVTAQTNSVILKDGIGNVISNHNSIQNAYDAIPSTLTQAYVIEIDVSYTAANEVFPITFINKTGASSGNTITLTIADNISTWKNITCGTDTSSILILDDADWIIIDGLHNLNTGSDGIRFINMAANGIYPLVHILNGASNNVINNCVFQSLAMADSTAGLLLGESVSNPSGNSYNTIVACDFNLC